MTAHTAEQVEQTVNAATINQLLAALNPDLTVEGGACPTCHTAGAWATDTLNWTCDRDCHGTIWQLRADTLADPDALARLLQVDRIAGQPIHPRTTHLPPVIDPDGWATPTDLFRAFVRPDLDYDEQLGWLRTFAQHHGQPLLQQLLDGLTDPTPAMIDALAGLRSASQAESTVAA